MFRSKCMVVALVTLAVAPQPATDSLPQAAERPMFMQTKVFAKTIAYGPVRDAHPSPRQERRDGVSAQINLAGAELFRAQLVLLRAMDGMGQTLDGALQDRAFVHDRQSMKALNAASHDFKKMATNFRSMVRQLTQAVHGAQSPNDGGRMK